MNEIYQGVYTYNKSSTIAKQCYENSDIREPYKIENVGGVVADILSKNLKDISFGG